jgi:hypothetical protein
VGELHVVDAEHYQWLRDHPDLTCRLGASTSSCINWTPPNQLDAAGRLSQQGAASSTEPFNRQRRRETSDRNPDLGIDLGL